LVAAEIVKGQIHSGKAKALYHFRDQQGLEVDFVVPQKRNKLILIEAKSTKTPKPSTATSLLKLSRAISNYNFAMHVVHQPAQSASLAPAIARGVRATPWTQLSEVVGG
jgi:predicted AAA+ superfamily ATPase